MGKVIILPETTTNPITLMGQRAGICWGADTQDQQKNYNRGMDCLVSNHGRVLEFVNVELALCGYSAKVMREWYTHIGCLPSRLQASTRYINYKHFDYVTPKTILANADAKARYDQHMKNTQELVQHLESIGIPREDATYPLPFAMETVIMDKRNLRNYIDMAHTRKCIRALWEFRDMFDDITNALSQISEEWEYITKHYFVPKCELFGYCTEKKSCNRKPKKRDMT